MPAPRTLAGAGACLPGQLSGVDACGPLARRQLPRLADDAVIVSTTALQATASQGTRLELQTPVSALSALDAGRPLASCQLPRHANGDIFVRISRIISGSRFEISKSDTGVNPPHGGA